jgi:hypothetical protein
MALAFGGALGSVATTGVTTTNFATTANVTAGGLIVAAAGLYKNGSVTSLTVSGGGLTWQVDKFATPNGADLNYVVAEFSAIAPVGLSSGTTLTLTLNGGGGCFDLGFCAVYFTGTDAVTWRDVAGAGSAVAAAAWTTSVTSTNADDVIVGFAWRESWSTADHLPGAGWTQGVEFTNATDPCDYVLVYQIVASATTYSPNGTFGGGAQTTAVAVAYKAAAGGGGAVAAVASLDPQIQWVDDFGPGEFGPYPFQDDSQFATRTPAAVAAATKRLLLLLGVGT